MIFWYFPDWVRVRSGRPEVRLRSIVAQRRLKIWVKRICTYCMSYLVLLIFTPRGVDGIQNEIVCHKQVNKVWTNHKMFPIPQHFVCQILALIGQFKWLRNCWLLVFCMNTAKIYCWNKAGAHICVSDTSLRLCNAVTCPSFWKVGTWTILWGSYMSLLFEDNLLGFYYFIFQKMFFSFCDNPME